MNESNYVNRNNLQTSSANTNSVMSFPYGDVNLSNQRVAGNSQIYIGFTQEQIEKKERSRLKKQDEINKINIAFTSKVNMIFVELNFPQGKIKGEVQNATVGRGSILKINGSSSADNIKIGENSFVYICNNTKADDMVIGNNTFIYLRNANVTGSIISDFCTWIINASSSIDHVREQKRKFKKFQDHKISQILEAYKFIAFTLWKSRLDENTIFSTLPLELINTIAINILKF